MTPQESAQLTDAELFALSQRSNDLRELGWALDHEFNFATRYPDDFTAPRPPAGWEPTARNEDGTIVYTDLFVKNNNDRIRSIRNQTHAYLAGPNTFVKVVQGVTTAIAAVVSGAAILGPGGAGVVGTGEAGAVGFAEVTAPSVAAETAATGAWFEAAAAGAIDLVGGAVKTVATGKLIQELSPDVPKPPAAAPPPPPVYTPPPTSAPSLLDSLLAMFADLVAGLENLLGLGTNGRA